MDPHHVHMDQMDHSLHGAHAGHDHGKEWRIIGVDHTFPHISNKFHFMILIFRLIIIGMVPDGHDHSGHDHGSGEHGSMHHMMMMTVSVYKHRSY